MRPSVQRVLTTQLRERSRSVVATAAEGPPSYAQPDKQKRVAVFPLKIIRILPLRGICIKYRGPTKEVLSHRADGAPPANTCPFNFHRPAINMATQLRAGFKLLTEVWYKEKSDNQIEERKRIVKAAAVIVTEDIRSRVYEIKHYPLSNNFFQDIESSIPETLRIFLDGINLKNKIVSLDKWKKKSIALAYSIIAAARPKSFISSVQVRLAVILFQKYGSRRLIDTSSSLGFCSSYTEAMLFKFSAIMRSLLNIDDQSFSQFVFDNADFNTQTLDGHNTFHVMGDIHCITSKSAIAPDQNIERLKQMPSAKVTGSFGATELKTFTKKNDTGLKTIQIQNLGSIRAVSVIILSVSDLLWLYGKCVDLLNIPAWSGFMEQATAELPFEKSFIECLPFINAPPSDYDTILTDLLFVSEKCESLHQHTYFVTFDQPLYFKAREIISSHDENSKLNNTVVRLGELHLLMSFMGSIGYIMTESGLKELFNTIYVLNLIEKMMAGHAYSRAVRAHMLTHLLFAKIVLQFIDLTPDLIAELDRILCNFDRSVILEADQEECSKELADKFENELIKLEQRGATAKLWVQYFRMVTILKQLIEAERMGNWN
ncbi:hypothetical protein EVAR_37841_1 [Eumeta japonica]|uniref:Uncharacterized protein n=1 Tax=Eumeta variegata TaxID=151549 RepID=A0A4C1X2G4_EUMVA|nr:hypothetical protein EVAR_37841_1 [Eumeta japonica]